MSPGSRTICISNGSRTARSNVAANCIDRHLAKRGNQTAIIWEGDDPKDSKRISYRQLHEEVCRFANVLKARGVKKGDRVTIYLPMIPEAAYAMLACARIGAIHSVVFGGFSPDSLAGRITDCDSRLVITADEGLRAGQARAAEGQHRRSLEEGPRRHRCDRGPAHRRQGDDAGRAATAGITRKPPRSPPTARPRRWGRKIRSSSSTPPARRESPRACCTPPAAICSMPPPPITMSSIITRAMSTGAPPMSAG